MTRGVPQDRAQLIADLARDEWISRLVEPTSPEQFDAMCEGWETRLRAFLELVEDPLELHLFADLWNWDGADYGPLEATVTKPTCERATALLLFWRAQAEDFVGLGDVADAEPCTQPRYVFADSLQRRYLAGEFVAGDIWYDPQVDYKLAGPSVTASGAGWRISPLMYQAVGRLSHSVAGPV